VPDGQAATFQVYDETGQGRREIGRILHGSLAQHWRELKALNEAGAGIFVAVNQTDGRGRRIENITQARALLLDLDGAPLSPVLAARPKPHLIVETSAGRFHCLWLVDDCHLAEYPAWQTALASRFDGDLAVKDVARCVRLPGHWNHKRGKPELCRLLVEAFARPYPLAEIVAGLGLERRAPEAPRRPLAARSAAPQAISPYCRSALERACTAIVRAPAGQQELILNSEAFGMGQLVEGGMPPTIAIEALVRAGLLMLSHDSRRPWIEREVRSKVKRAFGHGVVAPRTRQRLG
jgi:hypothetical protein